MEKNHFLPLFLPVSIIISRRINPTFFPTLRLLLNFLCFLQAQRRATTSTIKKKNMFGKRLQTKTHPPLLHRLLLRLPLSTQLFFPPPIFRIPNSICWDRRTSTRFFKHRSENSSSFLALPPLFPVIPKIWIPMNPPPLKFFSRSKDLIFWKNGKGKIKDMFFRGLTESENRLKAIYMRPTAISTSCRLFTWFDIHFLFQHQHKLFELMKKRKSL